MLADVADSSIDHKEVLAYARGANVMLGAARVGALVGFGRDLLDGGPDPGDESARLLREEAELTARLEEVRARRAARSGGG
jgi:hypothetical protein